MAGLSERRSSGLLGVGQERDAAEGGLGAAVSRSVRARPSRAAPRPTSGRRATRLRRRTARRRAPAEAPATTASRAAGRRAGAGRSAGRRTAAWEAEAGIGRRRAAAEAGPVSFAVPSSRRARRPTRLVADGLAMRFGRRRLFEGLTVEVEAGAPLAVVGRERRRARARCCCCSPACSRPTPGRSSLAVGGRPCAPRPPARRSGFVAPALQLYEPLTARENLDFLARARGLPGRRDGCRAGARRPARPGRRAAGDVLDRDAAADADRGGRAAPPARAAARRARGDAGRGRPRARRGPRRRARRASSSWRRTTRPRRRCARAA